MPFRRIDAASLALAAIVFIAVRYPLLAGDGMHQGFNSDSAIIGLMGRKLLEGRGFDFFFWGQSYLGPLTSWFAAAAGALIGHVGPLALRAGALVEVFLGIVFVWLGLWRLDARVANVVAIALAIGPPVLYSFSLDPYGAEMAFTLGAALFAFGVRQLTTAEPSHASWLAFGVLAGFSWWMTQQVVFTLLALGAVLAMPLLLAGFRIGRSRLLRGPLVVRVLQALGVAMLAVYFIGEASGWWMVPFVLSPTIDALLLIVVPALFVRGEPLKLPRVRLPWIALPGFALGYAPVWLGRLLDWYPRSYVFHFSLNYPSGVIEQGRQFFSRSGSMWMGANMLLVVVCVAVAARKWRTWSDAMKFTALIPPANLAFYLLSYAKPHYLISSSAMLLALAVLGALAMPLWLRAIAFTIGLVTMTLASLQVQQRLLGQPDPRPLLREVAARQCTVVYADFWVAYHQRFIEGERRAWVPYNSQDRTRDESLAARRLPGQRCLVRKDGRVELLAADPPIRRGPPSASLRPGHPPAAR
ncbi:MAG TPA: hypothetical protein VGF69_24910 [Thermoanaerobaculia bacterium]|jgi:hypothetical protein